MTKPLKGSVSASANQKRSSQETSACTRCPSSPEQKSETLHKWQQQTPTYQQQQPWNQQQTVSEFHRSYKKPNP